MLIKAPIYSAILASLLLGYSAYSTANNTSKNSSILAVKSSISAINVDDYIETIIVTASKRKQSLQKIPLAANVLNSRDIIELGIIDIENILTQFPNLSSNATTEHAFGSSIPIIGTNDPHGHVSQAEGVYCDETRMQLL